MSRLRILLWGCALLLAPEVSAEEPAGSWPPDVQQLAAHLDDKDVYERQKAFLRVEATRNPAFLPLLQERLKSRNADTRTFSVRALGAIAGAAAIPALLDRAAHDRQSDVRVAALLTLEPLRAQDPASESAFIKALRDRHPDVRMAAVDLVSRNPSAIAREAILTRWKRERHRDVRRVLEDAMARIGAPMK